MHCGRTDPQVEQYYGPSAWKIAIRLAVIASLMGAGVFVVYWSWTHRASLYF